ncbi:MAG: biosynthetic-type acetolactate synthase large subunit [Bifidobacteriaceae bacterium]|nr:biosynthetic-type acetolactate synthase large subunit [Bifidobacteriaceae bacterium]
MTKKLKLQEAVSGSKLLLDTVQHHGVDTIFGYPGGAVLPLYDAIYSHPINHILTRHEQGALHAAEGYAKRTGKPGVVIVTSGPGATNAITGIADAMGDSVPLIVITGQVGTPGIGKDAFQEADMLGITMPITKYNYQVRDTKDLPRVINEAFHIATTGRKGPVVIDLPKDIQAAVVTEINDPFINLPSYQPHTEPNMWQMNHMFKALSTAKKPLILVGGGVNYAKTSHELIALAEKHKIPVVASLLGLGAMPLNHPLFFGFAGMHGAYAANMALVETDFLLSIGCRFDDRLATNPADFAPNAKIAHIDIDPAEIGKIIHTDYPIVADAKKALTKMLELDFTFANTDKWRAELEDYRALHPLTYNRTEQTEIKPQRVVELVGKITDGEAIIVTDVGQHQMWAAQFYPFKEERQLITSGSLGTMGFGIPAAIGAKLADPAKQVVLFVGDGGFQMTSEELAILKVYGIDIKIIIMNNMSLGMVRQWQENFYENRHSESVFVENLQPDFVMLANAYHMDAVKLDNPLTIEQDLRDFLSHDGAILADIVISPTEHVLPMIPPGNSNSEMLGVE